jgi:hypothetical protein
MKLAVVKYPHKYQHFYVLYFLFSSTDFNFSRFSKLLAMKHRNRRSARWQTCGLQEESISNESCINSIDQSSMMLSVASSTVSLHEDSCKIEDHTQSTVDLYPEMESRSLSLLFPKTSNRLRKVNLPKVQAPSSSPMLIRSAFLYDKKSKIRNKLREV